MLHLNIKISGQVQGVFFRASAKEKALEQNLNGFAENSPDGSVYIEVEGERENVGKFLKWCYSGPSMAEVEKVESWEEKLKNFKSFKIT